MNINLVSPNLLFGGTWELLKDRFLLGAGNLYSTGSTGGSTTHTNVLNADGAAAIRNYAGTLIFGDGSNAGGMRAKSGQTWSFDHPVDAPRTDGTDHSGVKLYGKTGEGSSMPPYLAVYIWKRTA